MDDSSKLIGVLQSTRYSLIRIRSKPCYFIFQAIQLILATSIMILGLSSNDHFKNSTVMTL